jgi:hypothetical protein
LPDFSWRNIPKLGKLYPKRPQNIPNDHRIWIPNAHKIYQQAVIYTKNFHCNAFRNKPKLGFLVWKYMYHLATLARRSRRIFSVICWREKGP